VRIVAARRLVTRQVVAGVVRLAPYLKARRAILQQDLRSCFVGAVVTDPKRSLEFAESGHSSAATSILFHGGVPSDIATIERNENW
jgi:hypothetical protein